VPLKMNGKTQGEPTTAPLDVRQVVGVMTAVVVGVVLGVVVGAALQVRTEVAVPIPQWRPVQQVPTRLAQSWLSSRHCMYWQ